MARSRGRAALLRAALLATAAHVTPAARAAAQPVLGGFDDASLPARWEARLRVGARFEATTEQFGGLSGTDGSTRVPLGARFSFDSLGASRLPIVARTQRLLGDSLGVETGLTLGTVTTGSRALVTRVPIRLDLGVTRRIALGVTLPYVRTRQSASASVNPGGTTGNLGFNPAIGTVSSASAATAAQGQNKSAIAQLTTAADLLASRLGSCPATAGTGTPAECLPIIANRAAATQLVARARRTAGGLTQVYGTGAATSPGAVLVPIQGTDAQRAVNAQLTALATQFTGFQIPGLTSALFPSAATARIGIAGLQRILVDPDFGVRSDSLRGTEQAQLGDVEVGGAVMWLDTFGGGATAARRMPGLRVRSTVGAAYRLATGAEDVSYILFDVPTGSGSPALLLHSATDVSLGRRFWASAVARLTSPFEHDVVARIAPFPGELLAAADREHTVGRTEGRTIELEVTPRWMPNDAFAIAAHYALRSKADDRYTGSFAATDTIAPTEGLSYDASALGAGTGGRAQVVGFGITYSTLGAFARGRTWLPAEVSYLHTSTVAGSGGVVPRVRTDQLVLRVYAQLRGRSARRAR